MKISAAKLVLQATPPNLYFLFFRKIRSGLNEKLLTSQKRDLRIDAFVKTPFAGASA
ncbi:MAG: hypothetical protein WCI18_12420 [Pseudomonadota bacterium]